MRAVINTTPLISLAILDRLGLLDELFDEIIIPGAVFREATAVRKRYAGQIKTWGREKVLNIKNMKEKAALELILDEGESEVIVLAQEIGANLVIIDENKARRVARLKMLETTGSIGILLYAKELGKVSVVRPLLDRLINEGIDIGKELYDRACSLSNED
ncbi:MAG: DUF3368 domain-containing protein [Proteobacteria bacterium]|nr:DUF3368 domain-containing protein [Pseudomonadota bacterium]